MLVKLHSSNQWCREANLRWTDIDLDGATLCVKQAISRIKGMGLAAAEPEDRSFAPHVIPSG